MSFKALAVDIDGTITDPSRRIETLGIETLRELEAKGVRVVLATGNVLPVALGLKTFIGLSGPVVAETGGVVYHDGEIHLLEDGEGPRRAYERISAIMDAPRLLTDRWRLSEVAMLPEVSEERVREAVKGMDVRVESSGFAVHLLGAAHDKMAGVRKAASLLGIDVEDFLAVGDSDNDMSMLAGCGMGVAVANATPGAKSVADMVTEGKHSAGMREALIKLGMI